MSSLIELYLATTLASFLRFLHRLRNSLRLSLRSHSFSLSTDFARLALLQRASGQRCGDNNPRQFPRGIRPRTYRDELGLFALASSVSWIEPVMKEETQEVEAASSQIEAAFLFVLPIRFHSPPSSLFPHPPTYSFSCVPRTA